MRLAPSNSEILDRLAAWVAAQRLPIIVGISGAQGAGKSTLTALFAAKLDENFGLKAASLSLDDLYLTRAERQSLARAVHTLFATRGIPGTHDVALGIRLLNALKRAKVTDAIPLPAFDKAINDPLPQDQWPVWRGPADVVLFEGWCVGARPQPGTALSEPINKLERHEDPDGRWRRYVNAQLQENYPLLFSLLDRLVMLKVPEMDCAFRWRLKQEQELAARYHCQAGQSFKLMDEAELKRFVQHYERLTRWMLEEMPKRADVVIHLDRNHNFDFIQVYA